jgi:Acyl-protein synthetase, LuxE
MRREWIDKILSVKEDGFEALALEIFRFQHKHNPVYNAYVNALNILPDSVDSISAIPFLPVRFFRSQIVKTTIFDPECIFESSGTTGASASRHYIKDILLYEENFIKCFESFYGPLQNFCILGLLPSYLERNNSSLVYMVDKLILRSGHPKSGFYLKNTEQLLNVLDDLNERSQPVLLIGVTFALLDLANEINDRRSARVNADPLSEGILRSDDTLIIMETGGMKGRKEEMVRQELHELLMNSFRVKEIHSEYGMTELLSQAYSKGGGIFKAPPWMNIVLRDEDDPLQTIGSINHTIAEYQTGPINIIDLANVYSCSFIATDDVGKQYPDGSFEVLGRIDSSDLRGCSLMAV